MVQVETEEETEVAVADPSAAGAVPATRPPVGAAVSACLAYSHT